MHLKNKNHYLLAQIHFEKLSFFRKWDRLVILLVRKNRFPLKTFIDINVLFIALSGILVEVRVLKSQTPIFPLNKLAQPKLTILQYLKTLLQTTSPSLHLLLGFCQMEKTWTWILNLKVMNYLQKYKNSIHLYFI